MPEATPNRPCEDLREFIDRAERAGELLRIKGVDWNLEMGTLAEIVYQTKRDAPPAILFEDIPGYPKGMRVLAGATNSSQAARASPWASPSPRARSTWSRPIATA